MVLGDAYQGLVTVPAGGYLDIQPPSGVEAVIHNIFHEYDVDLQWYDGTNALTFDTDLGAGVYAKYAFHVTNSIRIRVYNRDTANARKIGYDGIQSK